MSLSCPATPSLAEFKTLAQHAKLIPVYREILADEQTPVSALCKLGLTDCTFLLESVEHGELQGRYSFLGNSAHYLFSSRGNKVIITDKTGCQHKFSGDSLSALQNMLASLQPAQLANTPPFYGGAVGYIGYSAIHNSEHHSAAPPDDLNLPDMYFIIPDRVLAFDHTRRCLKVVINVINQGDADACYEKALKDIDHCLLQLSSGPAPQPLSMKVNNQVKIPPYISSLSATEFMEKVARCQEYIASGDTQQIVLSQRLAMPLAAPPFNVYRLLRTVNPSPYMYYFQLPQATVVGSSPEALVRLENNTATLRPIAGTRQRGKTIAEDNQLVRELLADKKEIAEHEMLVELGRAELEKVCQPASVEVDQFLKVERYSHVMHIVSNIKGELAADKNAFDLLRATFPAGTVTGDPKMQAMQIIDELEPLSRGLYAGSVGYIGFNGQMDFCITIRTAIIKDRTAYVQAGAGIVADSIPQREYEETLHKAQAMLSALSLAITNGGVQ
jgi:anthranilate synthase component 1